MSPPSFQHPQDLAGGDKRAVARVTGGRLPWEDGENVQPTRDCITRLCLGTVNMEAAVAQLMGVYADTRVERHATARGEAVLAMVMVDREGRPIEEPATAISSFGWAVPRSLSADLDALGARATAEKPLVESLDQVIRQEDRNGDLRPLDVASIHNAYDWLVSTLGLPADVVKPPTFCDTYLRIFRKILIRLSLCC